MNKYQWAVLIGIIFILIGILLFMGSIGGAMSNPFSTNSSMATWMATGAGLVVVGLIIIGIARALHSVR
jgi:uncharacterized membrane protein YidH (DUF202 family)